MIDWTSLTMNPVDEKVYYKVLNYITERRKYEKINYFDFLLKMIKGKDVLDIGAAEHDVSHIEREGWKHEFIKQHSNYVLGIDIIKELVDLLNNIMSPENCT